MVVMEECEWCRRGVVCRMEGGLAGVLLDGRLGGALVGSVYPNCLGGRDANGIALGGGGGILQETLGRAQLSRGETPHLSMSSWIFLFTSVG